MYGTGPHRSCGIASEGVRHLPSADTRHSSTSHTRPANSIPSQSR